MRWITRSLSEIGSDFSLSPEHWLAGETARSLASGVRLGDIVHSISQTQVPPVGSRFVLDTGNAREGLLDITILGDPVSGRTSAKKVVTDGDVIISRLRPYLRQVAWIPPEACSMLEVEKIYCSTEFFVLRGRDPNVSLAGLVAWLLSDPIQQMVSAAATGGHHPRISIDLLLDAPVSEKFLDPVFGNKIGVLLRRHLESQRELNVLLRH